VSSFGRIILLRRVLGPLLILLWILLLGRVTLFKGIILI
jgi:hypothetical protein